MSDNFYTIKKMSSQHKNYLFEQYHPNANHKLSKFIIKKDDDTILFFYSITSLPSAISDSYHFVSMYHSFFKEQMIKVCWRIGYILIHMDKKHF